jgi:hypothetical protein
MEEVAKIEKKGGGQDRSFKSFYCADCSTISSLNKELEPSLPSRRFCNQACCDNFKGTILAKLAKDNIDFCEFEVEEFNEEEERKNNPFEKAPENVEMVDDNTDDMFAEKTEAKEQPPNKLQAPEQPEADPERPPEKFDINLFEEHHYFAQSKWISPAAQLPVCMLVGLFSCKSIRECFEVDEYNTFVKKLLELSKKRKEHSIKTEEPYKPKNFKHSDGSIFLAAVAHGLYSAMRCSSDMQRRYLVDSIGCCNFLRTKKIVGLGELPGEKPVPPPRPSLKAQPAAQPGQKADPRQDPEQREDKAKALANPTETFSSPLKDILGGVATALLGLYNYFKQEAIDGKDHIDNSVGEVQKEKSEDEEKESSRGQEEQNLENSRDFGMEEQEYKSVKNEEVKEIKFVSENTTEAAFGSGKQTQWNFTPERSIRAFTMCIREDGYTEFAVNVNNIRGFKVKYVKDSLMYESSSFASLKNQLDTKYEITDYEFIDLATNTKIPLSTKIKDFYANQQVTRPNPQYDADQERRSAAEIAAYNTHAQRPGFNAALNPPPAPYRVNKTIQTVEYLQKPVYISPIILNQNTKARHKLVQVYYKPNRSIEGLGKLNVVLYYTVCISLRFSTILKLIQEHIDSITDNSDNHGCLVFSKSRHSTIHDLIKDQHEKMDSDCFDLEKLTDILIYKVQTPTLVNMKTWLHNIQYNDHQLANYIPAEENFSNIKQIRPRFTNINAKMSILELAVRAEDVDKEERILFPIKDSQVFVLRLEGDRDYLVNSILDRGLDRSNVKCEHDEQDAKYIPKALIIKVCGNYETLVNREGFERIREARRQDRVDEEEYLFWSNYEGRRPVKFEDIKNIVEFIVFELCSSTIN